MHRLHDLKSVWLFFDFLHVYNTVFLRFKKRVLKTSINDKTRVLSLNKTFHNEENTQNSAEIMIFLIGVKAGKN